MAARQASLVVAEAKLPNTGSASILVSCASNPSPLIFLINSCPPFIGIYALASEVRLYEGSPSFPSPTMSGCWGRELKCHTV